MADTIRVQLDMSARQFICAVILLYVVGDVLASVIRVVRGGRY